jgi:hypothetical protein
MYQSNGRAKVWLNRQEISDKIIPSLKDACSTPKLHLYMKTKYNWDNAIIKNIDWTTHSRALQLLQLSHRKTITQFIHQWLPVNGQPGRALHANSQYWPTCRTVTESQSHFLQCATNIAQLQKLMCHNSLDQRNDDENIHLWNILQWSIINTSNKNAIFPQHTVPPQYHRFIQEQELIGWDQIVLGRWTMEWVHQLNRPHPNKGADLAAQKLSQIWHTIIHLWHFRCDSQHNNKEALTERLNKTLHPKVLAIYAQKHRLDHVDQQIVWFALWYSTVCTMTYG